MITCFISIVATVSVTQEETVHDLRTRTPSLAIIRGRLSTGHRWAPDSLKLPEVWQTSNLIFGSARDRASLRRLWSVAIVCILSDVSVKRHYIIRPHCVSVIKRHIRPHYAFYFEQTDKNSVIYTHFHHLGYIHKTVF